MKNEGVRDRERDACKDKYCFLRFCVWNMDIKILIGQIFTSVKILLFGGVLIKNRMLDCHIQTRWDIKMLKLPKQCGNICRSSRIMNQGQQNISSKVKRYWIFLFVCLSKQVRNGTILIGSF